MMKAEEPAWSIRRGGPARVTLRPRVSVIMRKDSAFGSAVVSAEDSWNPSAKGESPKGRNSRMSRYLFFISRIIIQPPKGCLVPRPILHTEVFRVPLKNSFRKLTKKFFVDTRRQKRSVAGLRFFLGKTSILDNAVATVRVLSGSDIEESTMESMYRFYKATNRNYGPWAAFYLNKYWFMEIGRRWRHRLLTFAAFQEGEPGPVGMSMVVRKGKQMIGRYWGT